MSAKQRPRNRMAVRDHSTAWAATAALFIVAGGVVGCASSTAPCGPTPDASASSAAIDTEVYRRAETERAARLAREVEQLRDDLRQAEGALVAAESGLRGSYSRADAISSLAEAQIHVARAGEAAPWRSAQLEEARAKLADAELQVDAGHFGAALFFVYRAERIADALQAEAERVHSQPGARFVRAPRVNLRAGPSTGDPVLTVLTLGTPVFPETRDEPWLLVRTATGEVGWLHVSLIDGDGPAHP